jgi:TRAP-type C4-dicarboxylate transport system permease small subunit
MDMLDILMAASLGAADGMSGLISTGESILKWAQNLAMIGAAIAFCIGGYYLIFGGERGRQKSITWFVGGAVGLVVVMGAYGLAQGVDSNIKFGG